MRVWKLLPAMVLLVVVVMMATPVACAQASAMPSAQPGTDLSLNEHGRKLLDQMVAALGGDAWLNRSTWVEYGQTGHFYKGQPDPYVVGFEDYKRVSPYAERVVPVVHISTLAILGLPGHNQRDTATVWNEQGGWELTFKGKVEVPKDDEKEYERVRSHSLEVVVKDWLKRLDVTVTDDGSTMVQRRLGEKVTVSVDGDSVVLALDESNHLPLSLTFKYRDDTYKDFDTETVEYDNYQPIDGILTPMAVTRFKNGDTVSQRFLTKVEYKTALPAELFNPDAPLKQKGK
jgi:hypothetical protein